MTMFFLAEAQSISREEPENNQVLVPLPFLACVTLNDLSHHSSCHCFGLVDICPGPKTIHGDPTPLNPLNTAEKIAPN